MGLSSFPRKKLRPIGVRSGPPTIHPDVRGRNHGAWSPARPLRGNASTDVMADRVSGHYEIKRVAANDDPSLDEAHALARVDDPHVSTAMEIAFERESRPSLVVIERPIGETLAHRGTLSPPRAVHVAIQIAHALHAAHQAGVIHRNVRPKNVMLVRTAVDDAFVKLTGFGKAPRKKPDRFVPPEGAAKKVAGPHTDIFGAGACLSVMLGRSRAREPELARIVARATATDPKDRYASAGELESALRAWSTARATRRDPAWYAMGILVAIGVGLILVGRRDAPAKAAPPLVVEAHAATPAPREVQSEAPPPVTKPADTATDETEFGPPSRDPSSAPAAPSPLASAKQPSVAPAPAKSVPTDEGRPGTFYLEEPLRYTSASEGEKWRVATTNKIAKCVATVGTGECALQSMQLHCTLDRHGVLHCSRLSGFDKAGVACAAPQPLEDCIGRAASGLIAHPKFEVADVQLAEMKYWIRSAP